MSDIFPEYKGWNCYHAWYEVMYPVGDMRITTIHTRWNNYRYSYTISLDFIGSPEEAMVQAKSIIDEIEKRNAAQ